MSRFGKWFALVAMAAMSVFSLSVQAGAPGPYRLAFVDISEAPYQDGQALAIELRKMERLSEVQKEDCFLCNGAKDNDYIGVIYLYTLPVGLDISELRAAVNGDDAAKRRMQTVLNRFVDYDGTGIDGLLIYSHREGKVSVYTMDRKIGSKLLEESRPVKNRLLPSSLDTLLEKAAEKLDRPV